MQIYKGFVEIKEQRTNLKKRMQNLKIFLKEMDF